jgi:hypothetical protein
MIDQNFLTFSLDPAKLIVVYISSHRIETIL